RGRRVALRAMVDVSRILHVVVVVAGLVIAVDGEVLRQLSALVDAMDETLEGDRLRLPFARRALCNVIVRGVVADGAFLRVLALAAVQCERIVAAVALGQDDRGAAR